MLRYKTETRPSLIALYDIRSGNGAGLFLQPQIPHGATKGACAGKMWMFICIVLHILPVSIPAHPHFTPGRRGAILHQRCKNIG